MSISEGYYSDLTNHSSEISELMYILTKIPSIIYKIFVNVSSRLPWLIGPRILHWMEEDRRKTEWNILLLPLEIVSTNLQFKL